MGKKPTPRAMRKALDVMEVPEAAPEPRKSAAPAVERTIVRRAKPDPLPKDMIMTLGRPGVYHEHYPEFARRLALVGVTDEEMAVVFGIAPSTLYLWDETHPGFKETRARGRVIADAEVATKLYHRATGYEHNAVKIFMPPGAEEPVYAPYVEHFAPDTQAATWWLKNRQKDRWADRSENTQNINVTLSGLIAESMKSVVTIEGETGDD